MKGEDCFAYALVGCIKTSEEPWFMEKIIAKTKIW